MSGIVETRWHLHRPQDIPALTGLRIVGAAWVALFHFQETLFGAWPVLEVFRPVLSVGYSGVPLFFILSGFIIWHNYGTPHLLRFRATCSFLWRRIARLWPVNILTQALAVPILWIVVNTQDYWGVPVPDWYSLEGWLQNAFMVQEIAQPEVVYQWNQPAWSLTAEMAAYVLFPALVTLALLLGASELRTRWIWLSAAMVLAFLAEASLHGFAYAWLVKLLTLFVSGVFLRLAAEPSKSGRPGMAALQLAAPVLVVVVCYAHQLQWMGLLLGLWVYSLSTGEGLGARFFTRSSVQTAGYASYSLYMLHWPLFMAGTLLLLRFPIVAEDHLRLYTIIAIGGLAIASWAMWRYFETPSRKRMNRLFETMWPAESSGSRHTTPSPGQVR